MLGVPGEGIHSYRIFDIAVMDVIMTIIGGFIIAYFFKLNAGYVIISLFILGIILHHVFCVRTTVDKILFK